MALLGGTLQLLEPCEPRVELACPSISFSAPWPRTGGAGHRHRLLRYRQRRHRGNPGDEGRRRHDHGPGPGQTLHRCPGAPSSPGWRTTSCRRGRWPPGWSPTSPMPTGGPPPPTGRRPPKPRLTLRSLVVIRAITRHGFIRYKQNTIRRRIERRMDLQQLETHRRLPHALSRARPQRWRPCSGTCSSRSPVFSRPGGLRGPGGRGGARDDRGPRPGEPPPGAGCRAAPRAKRPSPWPSSSRSTRVRRARRRIQVFATDIDGEAIARARPADARKGSPRTFPGNAWLRSSPKALTVAGLRKRNPPSPRLLGAGPDPGPALLPTGPHQLSQPPDFYLGAELQKHLQSHSSTTP